MLGGGIDIPHFRPMSTTGGGVTPSHHTVEVSAPPADFRDPVCNVSGKDSNEWTAQMYNGEAFLGCGCGGGGQPRGPQSATATETDWNSGFV